MDVPHCCHGAERDFIQQQSSMNTQKYGEVIDIRLIINGGAALISGIVEGRILSCLKGLKHHEQHNLGTRFFRCLVEESPSAGMKHCSTDLSFAESQLPKPLAELQVVRVTVTLNRCTFVTGGLHTSPFCSK